MGSDYVDDPQFSIGQADAHWYRALVESAPDAMVLVDAEGRIVLANAQTSHLFGYPREDLTGATIETLLPERHRERHRVHRDSYFASPEPRPMGAGLELWALRNDGTEFPVEISLSPLTTEQGVYTTAAIRDITLVKRAGEKFENLLEAAPDAMVIVNTDGRIELVNAQVEHLFGYRREALIGQPVEVLIPESLRQRHVEHRNSFVSQPKVRPMGQGLDLWARRKDGRRFPVEISLSPLKTEAGTLITAAIRDVTERRRAERERERYARELERSNRDLEQFAYFASHDLRAPLRRIHQLVGLMKQLVGESAGRRMAEYLELMDQCGAEMQDLIDELLALSRVMSREIEPEPVDTARLLEDVERQLADIVEESGATVSYEGLPTVSGSPGLLAQLFQNLVENAVKYRSEQPPRIRIASQTQDAFHHFTVADNGAGISEEERDIVFDMFRRGASGSATTGTGIGLAICRKVVEAHGGRIWAEPNEDAGTTFHFLLPAAG